MTMQPDPPAQTPDYESRIATLEATVARLDTTLQQLLSRGGMRRNLTSAAPYVITTGGLYYVQAETAGGKKKVQLT